ncbi:DUF4038 domain-containing protein [Flammeovirga yaeyamensis]|uniref:DUF4038 domain-containing protein n=1 Tax=Flammeovirga yaeyamensis TaxID=367791 RepID=A0AAX1NEM6_9BACT|nr:DUF4038 domain-containing protein [Flammeovirga yaeyamensis]MBB3696847.1 hypothetical protein [Flammeovirga yaeyamensis]NMF33513.1 DUF4038 domain-containing protein [Flammeovirga yaeyamensis]QWG05216.1 DUF4038 domain-containing protein [Flammeovirga yaeyamensis]
MRSLILTLLTFLIMPLSYGQIKVWKSKNELKKITTSQWEVNDLVFKAKKKLDKPFDVEVYAEVTNDQSEVKKVPLFYNGNGEWVFRFSSSDVGRNIYKITSSERLFDGRKGEIIVTENKKDDRHGSIVLNEESPQHFFYEDGKHYFNLAFECDWLFALDYGKEELSKTKHLLKVLNEYKFNQIVMNVYSYDVSWPKDPKLKDYPQFEYGSREDIYPFLGSNSAPDFSTLNVDFFQHLDQVISEMHDHEIVSHLMIYVWNKRVNWPDMNTEEDNRYYDYVIKRYQAFPNIVWDVSKEALLYGRATNEYISERIQRAKALDAYDRMISVHDYGFCKRHPDEVDFISMQNWERALYQRMMDAKNEFKKKPIFNIEHGGYEEAPFQVFPGAYTNAEACLRRNYECIFAGGYTTYYWQSASWNVVIHNPFQQGDDFEKPHFEYFTHMANLFDKFNFENFEPLSWFNSSGYNLTNKKDGVVMMYTPKECQWIGVANVVKKFDASEAKQQWFNTLTGEFSDEEPYNTKPFDFWYERPWKGEADVILIVKDLKPKEVE